MGSDFGVSISPRAQHGPLWTLSPRALRLWLFLAMKAQHTSQRYSLADHQKVTVARGQWLTSRRRLIDDAGYRSPKSLSADLRELMGAGAISAVPIVRERFQPRTSSGSQLQPGWWFQKGTAGTVLATLVTVHGLSHLAAGTGSNSEPKEIRAQVTLARSREEREWQHAQAQLSAEGR